MKRTTMLFAILMAFITGSAQNEVDNFNVGPYTVDYMGEGDVKYRLKDNIDLYEFFELRRDTTIIAAKADDPVEHAVELSGYLGSTRFTPKEVGIEGVWKQRIGEQLYFNGGLSLGFAIASQRQDYKRTMFEIGIPLQIELGKLNRQAASVYGSFGIAPTIYCTSSAKSWAKGKWEEGENKKSGFLIAPALEFGGNIPLGSTIIRIGVYGRYKINCTSGDYDVYSQAGKFILGAKIGFVL